MAVTTEDGHKAGSHPRSSQPHTKDSTHTDTREVEVITAEVENSLRAIMLRLLRPALHQTSELTARVEELQAQMKQNERLLAMVSGLRAEVDQQASCVSNLAEEIKNQETQSRTFERHVSGEVDEIRNGVQGLEARFETHEKELRQLGRENARTWKEAVRLQEQHDETVKNLWDGITLSGKQAERARGELLESIQDLQKQREELMEELYGQDKGLTRLDKELACLKQLTEPIPEYERMLYTVIDDVADLDSRHGDLKDRVHVGEHNFAEFSVAIDAKVTSIKEGINIEMNKLISHHTSLLTSARQECGRELEAARSMRQEFVNFQLEIKRLCDNLAVGLEQESRRNDILHQDITREIDENQKRRKKDRLGLEGEIQSTRKELASEQAFGRESRGKLDYLSRVVGLVLESERMASALSVQDFADRRAERWLGVASDGGRKPPPPQPVEVLEAQQQQHPRARCGSDLIQVDWRKGLARLEYLPGQVAFGSTCFERRDLLLHHKLLQKAHKAYARGPLADSPGVAMATSAYQPAVSTLSTTTGSAWAGPQPAKQASLAWERSSEDSEDPKPATAPPARPSSKQRPGSQGQPEGTGSRGTMFGPLGETTPKAMTTPTVPQFKLPSIGGCGDGAALADGVPRSLTAR